jgi:hypothetical protein
MRPDRAASRETPGDGRKGTGFFYFFRCNSLKSPDSDEQNQANPSNFVWIYLAVLGFAWSGSAAGPNPHPSADRFGSAHAAGAAADRTQRLSRAKSRTSSIG